MSIDDFYERHDASAFIQDEDEMCATSKSMLRNSTSVSQSIKQGRSALAEAEGHIRMFEEYLQSSAVNLNESYDDIFSDNDDDGNEKSLSKDIRDSHLDMSTSFTESLSDYLDPISDDVCFETSPLDDIKAELTEQLMQDGEEILKKDEIIASARRNGNTILSQCRFNHRSFLNSREKKRSRRPKSRGNFDPSCLMAAKRAAVRTSKVMEEATAAEAEALELSQFKARPLPGGGNVKNNPFALTKSARAKLNTSRESLSSHSLRGSKKLDASVLLGDESFTSQSPINNSIREDVKSSAAALLNANYRPKKSSSLRSQIYKAASTLIANTEDESSDGNEDGSESSSDGQDLMSLHQQISKLQAELKIKRLECIATISGFEKESKCTSVEDFGIPPLSKYQEEQSKKEKERKDNDQEKIPSSGCEQNREQAPLRKSSNKRSLYERQKSWLENKEKRRREAKEREEKDKVKDVTGRPDLLQAKKSWSKAKEEHAELIKATKAREKELQSEREQKYREQQLKKMEEAKEIQSLAKKRLKATKKGIDRNLQAEYIDKLSRPTNRSKSERAVREKEIVETELKISIDIKKEEPERIDVEERKIATPKTMATSFADMDDKEFAKMIKKIQTKARKKGKRSNSNTQDNFLIKVDTSMKDDNMTGGMAMLAKESPYNSSK